MKIICSWRRTDSCGRYGGDFEDILLSQEEWDEKSKYLEIKKPYTISTYNLGCGWTYRKYEMAMEEAIKGVGYIRIHRTYFLEGHEKMISCQHEETMNEYNS